MMSIERITEALQTLFTLTGGVYGDESNVLVAYGQRLADYDAKAVEIACDAIGLRWTQSRRPPLGAIVAEIEKLTRSAQPEPQRDYQAERERREADSPTLRRVLAAAREALEHPAPGVCECGAPAEFGREGTTGPRCLPCISAHLKAEQAKQGRPG